ncbi:MAG: murein biosynthesis integral membrane protein MurJ [Planctomycetota bacterium]|nr:murein biosynthesis integral membrane protein MurJ [Planctomycetota bacterium]
MIRAMPEPAGTASGRDALRGAAVTSAWTLVSRIAGYARDALLGAAFGMNTVQSALVLAWTVPNLFRRLFGEGAVSAAVQPALARAEHERGSSAAHDLFARFHGLLAISLVVIVTLGEAALLLGWLYTPAGEEHAGMRRTLLYSAFLLPYLLPICLAALLGAPQNLKGRFFLPAAGPVVLNLLWIAAMLWPLPATAGDDERAALIIGAILVGGVLQWAMQAPGTRATGFPVAPRFLQPGVEERRAVREFVPALLGLAAVQLAAVVDQLIVRWLVDETANSYTYYANRLLHLPLALLGLAAATGIMPLLARRAATGDFAGLGNALRRGSQSMLLLIFAAAAGMHALAEPIVRMLFERGRFEPEHTRLLALVLRAYLWSLPAAALGGVLARAYLACGKMRFQAWAAASVMPINLVADLVLVPIYGVPGAGWATAIALSVQCLILLRGLRALGITATPVRFGEVPALIAPGAAAWAAAWLTRSGMESVGAGSVAVVSVAITAGIVAAVLACALFRPADFAELSGALARRFKRR